MVSISAIIANQTVSTPVSNAPVNETPLLKCPKCGDFTECLVQVPDFQDRSYRMPRPCRCRTEQLSEIAKREHEQKIRLRLDKYRKYSLMDSRFLGSTFENWLHRPDNSDIYRLGKGYCDNWQQMYDNSRSILFHGCAGNGKTYLSFAIANELYKKGIPVMAISVSGILNIIKDSYKKHGETGEIDILNTLNEASLLILDDLGVEHKTSWAYEKLYAIIDSRYRSKKPIMLTTNFDLSALRHNLRTVDKRTGELDTSERIFSRITEMCAFYEVKGASLRILKGEQNKAGLLTDLGWA